MSGKLIIPNKSIRISNDSFNTSISNDSLDVHNFIWSTSALDWVRCTTSTSGEPVVSVSNFPSSYAVTGSVNVNNFPATQDVEITNLSTITVVGKDNTVSGTISNINETIVVPFAGYSSCAAVITGTWTGSLKVESSSDGGVTYPSTCWLSTVNQSVVANGIPIPDNAITANGTYKIFNTAGVTHYRIRATTLSSGSIIGTLTVVDAPASFIYTSGSIIQSVAADPYNSSEVNLAAGATFTGISQTTLAVVGIQVSLKTDQNCDVFVDQSPDGTNWDITDEYEYLYSFGGNAWTVQAVNSYYRVRVCNTGTDTTSYFRLQTALCPIVEAVPRSLDEYGNFKVGIKSFEDGYGFEVENTPNDEMRVVVPYRLIGSTFSGSTLDSNYWAMTTTAAGSSATVSNAQVVLSTGTTPNSTIALQTVRNARYVGGSANRARMVLRLPDTGTANNTRRWGAFNTTDGAFFELSGTTFKVVTRKTSNDMAISNGSFNGNLGATISLNTSVHTYEIYFNNSKVYFVRDSELIHTVSASSTTWTDTLTLPIRFENNNSGGSSTDVALNIRNGVLTRLGNALTQPTYKYQAGQIASLVLKYGAGNLHRLLISSVVNNSVVTLYDNTSVTASTIIWSSGTMGANAVPFSIDFGGVPFSTGLTLAITGANSNATVIYE